MKKGCSWFFFVSLKQLKFHFDVLCAYDPHHLQMYSNEENITEEQNFHSLVN